MWKFEDCMHCGNHTKKLWSILAINKENGLASIYDAITKDYKFLIIFGGKMSFGNNPDFELEVNSEYASRFGESIESFSEVILLEVCEACKKINIRDISSKQLLFPQNNDIVAPNEDMPDNIKEIYNEAAMIYNNSLRAALALLRLGLELLCDEVGYSSGKLYSRIEKLAEDGVIDDDIKYIAHGVRGLGNDAIHPKQIGDTATKEEVEIVFDLLNMITEELITKPRRKREFAVKYRK